MTSEQLQNARAARWRQAGNPLLTVEETRSWIEDAGLCLFAPRRAHFAAPAASLLEAVAGTVTDAPARETVETATTLLKRLAADGAVLPLNLFGGAGAPGAGFGAAAVPAGAGLGSFDTPDFLMAREVLPYVFSLIGGRNWKSGPGDKASPLMVEVWTLLRDDGAKTAAEIQGTLGREVTEAAVLRALGELWHALRVVPAYDAEETRWEVTQARFAAEMAASQKVAQTTALSALVSLYLDGVVAAERDEIEVFLSPLTARSRVREVVNGMQATRQLEIVSVGAHPLLHVTGSLPEFAAVEEGEQVSESADQQVGEPASGQRPVERKRFEKKPFEKRERRPLDRGERKPFERKPFERRSFERGEKQPTERKPFRKKEYEGERKSFERKPFERGERKPFERGEKKPFERKPFERGERFAARGESGGERRPFEKKRFEKKPFERGDRKPFERGEKKPFGRKPFERGERFAARGEGGERRPFEKKPFERKAFGKKEFDGERRSFERKSFDRGEKKPFAKKRVEGERGGFAKKRSGARGEDGGEKRPFFRDRGDRDRGARPEGSERRSFGAARREGDCGARREGGWKPKGAGFAKAGRPAFKSAGKPGFGESKPGGFKKAGGSDAGKSFAKPDRLFAKGKPGFKSAAKPGFKKAGKPFGKPGFSKGKAGAGKPAFGRGKPGGFKKPGGFAPPRRKRREEGSGDGE